MFFCLQVMTPSENNVDDFCRLCAVETKNGVIIYSSEGLHLCLEEKIEQCLRIEVSKDDTLPKRVCCPCRLRLEESHCFAEQANKVQRTLELLVQMSHLKKHTTSHNEQNINVKLEDEIDIKDEMEDSVLDTTVESDSGKQTVSKTMAHLDNYCVSDGTSSSVTENKKSKANTAGDFECPGKQTSRRKMQLPQKSSTCTFKLTEVQGHHSHISTLSPPSLPYSITDREDKAVESRKGQVEECVENEIDLAKTRNEHRKCELKDKEIDEMCESGSTKQGEEEEELQEKGSKEEWKTHWGIKCNQCNQIFPFRSQFDKHYQNSYKKEPTYTCSYCSKTMGKYSTFRSHCYRHVTEGRYRCEYCQKGFSLRSMLHVHILAKHTTVKPYMCEECGKGFVTRPGLNIHLKKHKTEEKVEYPCLDCGKILHTRGGLTAHQNVHKLGRRFMCDVCGKTFTQKVNMQQHVKHHTGERPFACEKCGKCFAEKSHLNRHYSFHSEKRPFQCTVCQKRYKTERCLKVHAMVHAEDRPYVCSFCNKGFLSTTKLKQHLNIHTGERPYACKFCERTFTNYPNWLKHTRRRHKEHMGNTSEDTCQQSSVNSQVPQQQRQHVVPVHGVRDLLENRCANEQCSLSEKLPQLSEPCVGASNTSSVNSVHHYPQSSHSTQVQSLSIHQMQETHSVAHDTLEQPTFSLSQVYPDDITSMNIPHTHSMLPL